MAKHRSYSIEFKRQVAQEFLGGETLHGLANRHDLSHNLIRIWVEKYEAGSFDEDAAAADLVQVYEARIAALERLVGKTGTETGVSKGGATLRTAAEKRAYVRDCLPSGISVARECKLMGIARSTYYAAPTAALDDTALLAAITAICDEFPDGAKDLVLTRRDQLWVADLTYVVIPGGVAHVAVILDAWSRRWPWPP